MEAYLLAAAVITGTAVITEVCSNAPDDASGEFVEIFNNSTESLDITGFTITDGDALDQLFPWTSPFPHPDAVTGTPVISPGGYAVILEEDYTTAPWLEFEPGTIILTTGDHALCNGLAASSDPLTLFGSGGTSSEDVLSTFGTPYNEQEWQDRDDDGLDSIPFDPGQGNTLSRYPMNSPDCEAAWFTGEPTPGAPPDAPPDTCWITIDSLYLSDQDPLPGTGTCFTAIVSCWGTVSPDTGSITLYLDINGDSVSQCDEHLLTVPASILSPGTSDTLEVFFTAPPQGWYPAVCMVPGMEQRIHFTTGGGVNPSITEVMANPLIEDQEEFIEIFYPGPGVLPLAGFTFTDGDAIDEIVHLQNSAYINPGQTGLIIDPEYTGTLNIPPGTPLFTPANTTLGNGLTTDDPVLLYNGEPSLEHLLATAGTPLLYDDPLMCDDDGIDGIPFDPGNGFSMEKVIPEGPDAQYNWTTSASGGTPGVIPESQGWTDLQTDSLAYLNGLYAVFSNCGALAADGLVTIFSDTNANLFPDPSEIIHQTTLTIEPGQIDSILLPYQPPDSGLFIISAVIENPCDTIPDNNEKHFQLVACQPAWPVVTEVLCNPSDQDCNEFIEVFFPGPGQVDMTEFTMTDFDSEDILTAPEECFLTPGGYALIMDPEYETGSMPYDIPPGTVILYPGNTTLGDGLSANDPVALLYQSTAVSEYGTPEDDTDEIPYNPGIDFSAERVTPYLPDTPENWFTSPLGPTPGFPPEYITEGADYLLTDITANPPMGPGGTATEITAKITSAGTESVSQGDLCIEFFAGEELIHTGQPAIPGLQDTVAVTVSWLSQENCTALTASISCQADQNTANNSKEVIWNPQPAICMNEIFYNEPEWIELFNGSENPVNLCSLSISDGVKTALITNVFMEPGSYAVITGNLGDFTDLWGNPPCQVIELENWPTLNNSGDSLILSSTSQALDMVPYSSDWGGSTASSLERRATDVMGFIRENWGTCTTGATPGEQNSIGEKTGTVFFSLTPTIFNPPDTPLHIEMNLPMMACDVKVKVYDVRGMELERLYDGIVPGETLILEWSGNDYPIGRYIIYASANCSGSILTDAGVVILARPLN